MLWSWQGFDSLAWFSPNTYTMKKQQLLAICIFILALASFSCDGPDNYYAKRAKEKYNEDSTKRSRLPKRLLTEVTDERGLTSVTFMEGGDTFGFDYLTKHELDSFKKAEGFK